MLARLQAKLVADWREAWRWSSVRLHLIAAAVGLLYEAMPVLDPSIAAMLPAQRQAKAIGLYALIGLILRLTKLKANG
jgi:hypothetical protein